jgi:hypothetical protein
MNNLLEVTLVASKFPKLISSRLNSILYCETLLEEEERKDGEQEKTKKRKKKQKDVTKKKPKKQHGMWGGYKIIYNGFHYRARFHPPVSVPVRDAFRRIVKLSRCIHLAESKNLRVNILGTINEDKGTIVTQTIHCYQCITKGDCYGTLTVCSTHGARYLFKEWNGFPDSETKSYHVVFSDYLITQVFQCDDGIPLRYTNQPVFVCGTMFRVCEYDCIEIDCINKISDPSSSADKWMGKPIASHVFELQGEKNNKILIDWGHP